MLGRSVFQLDSTYVVDEYFAPKLTHQRIVGTFDVDLPGIKINTFGVILKSGKSCK